MTSKAFDAGLLLSLRHELRSPLHTILGHAAILKHGGEPSARENQEAIEASGHRLLRLIDNLMDYAGGAEEIRPAPRPVLLESFSARIESMGRVLAKRRQNAFEIEMLDAAALLVEMDEERLARVLLNLVDLASKSSSGGIVRVSIRAEPVMNGKDGLRRFVFSVGNLGVSREEGDDPLELLVARQWVEAMDGTLHIDGNGWFSFSLVFPIGRHQPVGEAAKGHIVGYDGARRTLVVADDVPANLTIADFLCRRLGFDVIRAGDGNDALRACLENRPDAVLADQYMPGLDGWGLLRAVRESTALARLPVILVSAGESSPPEGFPGNLAFDAILPKPLTEETLAVALCNCLGIAWVRDPQAEARPEPVHLELPAEPELSEFRSLVRQGRLLSLEIWIARLASVKPEFGALAEHVSKLCRKVDLAGLESLIAGNH